MRSRAVTTDGSRIDWMDGLRGVAAMQVVLLHHACAFLPAIGFQFSRQMHFDWEKIFIGEPFSFLVDGSTAVYIFFVLSGAALTLSFAARPLAILGGAARRLIRLGLPMIAALIFAAAMMMAIPDAHVAAGIRTGSRSWLSVAEPVTPWTLAHQILFEGLLTGYREMSFVPLWARRWIDLAPVARALNGPLWTLHVEFCGSLLILVLTALRATIGRIPHLLFCTGFCVAFVRSPLLAFAAGHLLFSWPPRRPDGNRFGKTLLVLGVLLVAQGIWLAELPNPPLAFKPVFDALPWPPFGPMLFPQRFLQMVGAIAIFGGLTLVRPARNLLASPALRGLGRVSFSLYLTHVPILFTVTSALFAALIQHVSYGTAVATAVAIGALVSLLTAMAFARWVDGPAIVLSRRAGAGGGRRAAARREAAA